MAESAATQCCSLRHCLHKDRHIPQSACRVEVCTVLPQKLMKTQRDKFLVDWSKSGEAVFHRDCWSAIRLSAWFRKDKKAQFKLYSAEKLMIKEAAKTAEKHDGYDFVQSEGQRIAEMIKSSKHCVAFTGAGISTSAGIGDYRGKSGKWTQDERANLNLDCEDDLEPEPKRLKVEDEDVDSEEDECDDNAGIPYEELRPTYTHEALQHLLSLGYLKYIISQNCDGLHSLSGVTEKQISELHGNVFLEKCETCGHLYERNTYVSDDIASQYYEELSEHGTSSVIKPRHAVQCDLCGLSHRTGRRCTQKGCKGYLKDTIINFRDNLDDDILDRATEHAKNCDLMVCLGTTLRVTPACDLVEMGQEPLRIVICNRQKTSLDSLSLKKDQNKRLLGARIYGDCDKLMREIMKGILSQDALQAWEAQRDQRMKIYDKKRS